MDVFNELVKREPNLLAHPLKELIPISFVGTATVAAYRSLIGKLADLPMTQKQKEKTLADGQGAGKMLLAIEARIGELLPDDARNLPGRGGIKKLPENVTFRNAYKARQIARNPEAVEEVIYEAEQNEDIPTKTAVLNKIACKKEKERQENYKKATEEKIEQIKRVSSKEALNYLNILQRITLLLPVEPPEDWSEEGFAEAQALANIIRKRLEDFHD